LRALPKISDKSKNLYEVLKICVIIYF